jgi:hypothetical protein
MVKPRIAEAVSVNATTRLQSGHMDAISEDEFHSTWGMQAAASGDLLNFGDICSHPWNQVWTIVESGDDADGNWYAVPGMHAVNCLGYVLTIKPWDVDTPQAIYFSVGVT